MTGCLKRRGARVCSSMSSPCIRRGWNGRSSKAGSGLSGGQRQLVHLTRALLREPQLWLLDEPTASMDQPLERRIIGALRENLDARPHSTLVLVTHKPHLLALVGRLIVLGNGKIMLDGPRDQVLKKMQEMAGQVKKADTPQPLRPVQKEGVV